MTFLKDKYIFSDIFGSIFEVFLQIYLLPLLNLLFLSDLYLPIMAVRGFTDCTLETNTLVRNSGKTIVGANEKKSQNNGNFSTYC